MQTIAVRKEFILEGYNSACDEWKERLMREIPEAFTKPTAEELINNAGYGVVYGSYKVVVLPDSVLIPLPNANDEWTFEAFDLCKKICELLKQNEISAFPVHGDEYYLPFKGQTSTTNFIRIRLY